MPLPKKELRKERYLVTNFILNSAASRTRPKNLSFDKCLHHEDRRENHKEPKRNQLLNNHEDHSGNPEANQSQTFLIHQLRSYNIDHSYKYFKSLVLRYSLFPFTHSNLFSLI